MTPNLDAMGHQWLVPLHSSTLNWNTRKDMTTQWQMHLAELLLAWTQAHQAEVYDPAVVDGDCCLEQEVHVAIGCALVWMHVTDRVEAHKEDPMLSTVLNWLNAQKKTDLKALLAQHASSEEGRLILCNGRISWFIKKPCICTQYPKVRLGICSSWSPGPTGLPPWMGVTEM